VQNIAFIPGGQSSLPVSSQPVIGPVGQGAVYSPGALSVVYGGQYINSCNQYTTCGPTVAYPTDSLVIDYCDGGAVSQNTLTDSIGASTWAGGTGGLTYTGTYLTDGWWTLWQNGTNPGGATITCHLTGATNKYIISEVMAFSAASGWPASPLDQSGANKITGTGNSSITITASAQNANAVELETARVTCGTDNTYTGVDSSTPGWILLNTDPQRYAHDFYKISSTLETATIKVNFSSGLACDGMINTWKTN